MTVESQKTMAAHTDRMDALSPGTSGDYSLRESDRVFITPTGLAYSNLDAGQFPILTLDGETIHGSYDPSSEIETHLSLYREFDCGAVVHVHSPWATTVASLGEPLSYVHYAAALAGPEVPLVEYETYGTDSLAEAVSGALGDSGSSACLLENHGQVAVGESLEEAFKRAEAVEFTARVQCQARNVGSPRALSDEEIKRAIGKFEEYGQQSEDGTDPS